MLITLEHHGIFNEILFAYTFQHCHTPGMHNNIFCYASIINLRSGSDRVGSHVVSVKIHCTEKMADLV